METKMCTTHRSVVRNLYACRYMGALSFYSDVLYTYKAAC
jgi:hypothetical protein